MLAPDTSRAVAAAMATAASLDLLADDAIVLQDSNKLALRLLLHGQPHQGNVLATRNGPLFIDLETCCRGPVEFDLAHAPDEVGHQHPNADRDLLAECRTLVLAMVTAWRWDRGDQLPNGRRAARDLLTALREGPPWPDLDVIMGRPGRA